MFVRFVPASPGIRRHHLEDLFSQIGPIKKSSVILQSETSAYGFVRYTTAEDAALAAVRCNNQRLPGLDKIRVQVETAQPPQKRGPANKELDVKKTNRLILRNLSFYAKEKDIRHALERFGVVSEVHIPTVSQRQRTLSRGFGFVTFSTKVAALNCLNADEKIIIKDRPVDIAYAQHKAAFEEQKKTGTPNAKQGKKEERKVEDETKDDELKMDNDDDDDDESNDSEHDCIDEDSGRDDDDDDSHSSSSESQESHVSDDDNQEDESSLKDESESPNLNAEQDRSAVAEKRCLFVRNLPFDATRHDLFELFKDFGYISSIYIVRDKISGAPRGTAFVTFQKEGDAQNVIERGIVGPIQGSLILKGRELLIDLAVDKDTAGALGSGADKATAHKDRRNMYLITEGRVDNDEAAGKMGWDELPESDKSKRQSAWSDKNTKLKSPIFFINPYRLSIRNLSKQIDEIALKKLFVDATERGLRLVATEDQIAHWKAAGTMTTKDILARMKYPGSIIPSFDRSNIKENIPSVFIQRDFTNGKEQAMSRGFGFVEFKHHAHALACLRELNNNLRYSSEFAAGGKAVTEANKKRKSSKDPIPVPRLIVEFTIENKVKAKQQAERRAEQMANRTKQKEARKPKQKDKKRRGATQRERKRKRQDDANIDSKKKRTTASIERKISAPPRAQSTTMQIEKPMKKTKRPRKRVKTDADDTNFSKLVESYKKQAVSEINLTETTSSSRSTARWFD